MSDNIKVAIKVRPLIKRELDEKLEVQWAIHENTIVPLDSEQKKRGEGGYSFDHIFDMTQTNKDLFNVVAKPIIDQALAGYNGTIFAYGQTSSGKTYTMMGSRDSPGVIPLAIEYIFDTIRQSYQREYLLRVSYLEIYNERTYDLLDENKIDLKITEDPKTGQANVKCKEEVISTPERVLSIMKKGDRNRRTGETNMNERSSRSHTIFRVIIESREANSDSNGAVNVSQLNLVDLAGSERARQTGATGERFHEGVQINLSLSKLGLVIMQLSEDNPQKYVNFRDSKLTRILQSSLGGNAMTSIICAITPAAVEESQCTLAFASRAKCIKNKPQVNEVLSDQALLRRYAKQMSKLEEELEEAKSGTNYTAMASKLEEKDRALQLLVERHERLKKAIVGGCSVSDGESGIKRDRRRRTWAGSGTFQPKTALLPTIEELDSSVCPPSPKRIEPNMRIPQRQSILQTLADIAHQNFNTELMDFELELMESERANCESRLSSGSNANEEESYRCITTRPYRNVKIQEDAVTYESSDDSSETLSGRRTPESCSVEQAPAETPKPVLRNRLAFLMEQFHELSSDHRNLDEFTKLEKQVNLDEAVQSVMMEYQKLAAAKEELAEKYTNLEIHSAADKKRIAELEEQSAESAELEKQLVESVSLLKTLQNEKKSLIEELKTLKLSKPENADESRTTEREDYSSIFANATRFEEMSMSDQDDGGSMLIDDSQNSQYLEIRSGDDSTVQFPMKNPDESNLKDENSKLRAMLLCKAREREEINNAFREFKSGMESLQETVQQLTNENADLTSKLSAERERGKEAEKTFQSTIAELNSRINGPPIEEQVTIPENNGELSVSTSVDELQKLLTRAEETIASLTAENVELSSNLMSNIEELDRLKNSPVPDEHVCVYRDLSINLSERNKLLEAENIELSNSLMEKIEDYDAIKSKLESCSLKVISPNATLTESSKLIEISINHTNGDTNVENCSVESREKRKTVDDLLRFSLAIDDSPRETPAIVDTVQDLLDISLLGRASTPRKNNKNRQSDRKTLDNIDILNNKPSETIATCTQCTHLAELNADRQSLKIEVKAFNKKLRELQEKFDREYADSELLRTKANEEMDLSVCGDLTVLGGDSTLIEGGNLNVSFVDRNVQTLIQELETLREKHENLADLYKEKCDEIEKLQDSCSRETTPTPAFSVDSPKVKRTDDKYEKIQTKIETLRTEIANIADKNNALGAIVNEKIVKKKEVDTLRAVKADNHAERKPSSEREITDTLTDDNIMFDLNNEVARLNEEIVHYKSTKKELESVMSSLQAEVEYLRAEKADDSAIPEIPVKEQTSTGHEQEAENFTKPNEITVSEVETRKPNDTRTNEDIIFNLNNDVARLSEEIVRCNVAKQELESAMSIIQTEVEYLRAEKGGKSLVKKEMSFDEKSTETNDVPTTEDTILYLNNEVTRLNEELESVKRSSQAELEFLRSQISNETFSSDKESFQEDTTITSTTTTTTTTKHTAGLSTDENIIVTLKNDVACLNEEIMHYNEAEQELENEKSFLQAEVEHLKAGVVENNSVEEKAPELVNHRVREENIIFNLNEEVVRLNEKIIQCNVSKQELESAKSILQAEVEFLKAEKAKNSMVKKDSLIEEEGEKTNDGADTVDNSDKIIILNLTNEVARLNDEIHRFNEVKDRLERSNATLEAKVECLEAARDEKADLTKDERIAAMEIEVIRLGADIDASQIANQQLEAVKISLEVEISTLRGDSKARQERIDELLESLRNLETENSRLALTLAGMTAEKQVAEGAGKNGENELSKEPDENNSPCRCISELKSARESIKREIKSLKSPTRKSDNEDSADDDMSISQLFVIFVETIMSKEKQIIQALRDQFESEKRKLEEDNRQRCDGEKRATVWAKELEAEIERTQQDLARQEASTAGLHVEIAKLENLLKESTHENQVLEEKMKVLELDFNTLQGELSRLQSVGQLDSSQEREKIIQEAIDTKEFELSAKLRLVEKRSKEQLEESSKKLEFYRTKNLELTSTLEGLEANERQSKSIADMKTNELVKANRTIESLRGELEHLTESHNQLIQQHTESTRQVDEITRILKTKCDKLSEYKTKLETITPEYEHLKDQSVERQLRLEKYKSEIESLTATSDEEIAGLKNRLHSEEIMSASYRKQLEDLTNRNTVFQGEITLLRTKCEELERANAKLTSTMRNSTSKIRAEQEMEDLRDVNRTLQRNLDGASNRISDLQETKSNVLKELLDLRGRYDALVNENNETKSSHAASVNATKELREKYDSLMQEKSHIALAHEATKITIIQLENKLKAASTEITQLKATNKELDEEMDDMVGKIRELEKENAELDDKLYAITSENNEDTTKQLKTEIEKLHSQIESSKVSLNILRNENSELRTKYVHLERVGDSHVKSCDSSRSVSPALEAIRIDKRRRSSRTELFNLNRPLETVDTNEPACCGDCRCVVLQEEICKLERELVTKNGEIAAMEIRIQSENFPHMKRCKELDELLASSKRRCKGLEFELERIRQLKVMELSEDCDRCRHWRANKRDQSTQCLPESAPICLSGMSSGIVEDHLRMEKLRKDKEMLKNLCRGRQRIIIELEGRIKEFERQLKSLSTPNDKPVDHTINLNQ